MHLIQPRQIAGSFPGPTLSNDLLRIRNQISSGNTNTFDILNSEIDFNGEKTFLDNVYFDHAIDCQKATTAISASGDIFLRRTKDLQLGSTLLYLTSDSQNEISLVSNAAGNSGEINFTANSGINFNSDRLDLTSSSEAIIDSSSASAFQFTAGNDIPLFFQTNESTPRIGILNNNPATALDISGTLKIDSNGFDSTALTLGNTGFDNTKVKFNSVTGANIIEVVDNFTSSRGMYVSANTGLPLYLGHDLYPAMKIEYSGIGSRVTVGGSASSPLVTSQSSSVFEVHRTGSNEGPDIALVNDSTDYGVPGPSVILKHENSSSALTGQWIMGSYLYGQENTFKIGYYTGVGKASIDGTKFLNINSTGSFIVSGEGPSSINDGGPGNLETKGNLITSSGLRFADYANIPTSDPGIEGVVWRDGATLKISAG